ncbi:glycoside hydrolase family 30 beta sandwich domain-containing protein [Algoriphagus boritolerans]|uniref:glycoside hydrolase family 30 beta sandwich domain-containing protein n=1 Tax=Algoriphagus boritolerans TaxID=308111 RepID=UPI003A0FCB2D
MTVAGDSVSRNPAYYIIAHASKFVEPGSVRIDSNIFEGLHNVAFLRPDGKKSANCAERRQRTYQLSNRR